MFARAFTIGHLYTREDVANAIGYPEAKRAGDFNTGYFEHENTFLIFSTIGSPARTGHDYPNRWDGHDLVWYGKSRTRLGQPQISEMIGGAEVLIFWRATDRPRFTYAGSGRAVAVADTTPVEVRWSFDEASRAIPVATPAHYATPSFHRGPQPAPGARTSLFEDGETFVYIMLLVSGADRVEGSTFIKVGISKEPEKRVRQLNAGFPPTFPSAWTVSFLQKFACASEAFDVESRVLEHLRISGRWIGGEFGVVPVDEIAVLTALVQRMAVP